ncbi:MAG: hypothetical protein IT348_15150, partial [Candidatus Eisenbacteria bacterium]|nr:hypothetical protein [Candidatus Eisenbacteria bacterium]
MEKLRSSACDFTHSCRTRQSFLTLPHHSCQHTASALLPEGHPGFGYAGRSKAERTSWGSLIEGYLRERASLRGVVLLVDVRRGLEEEEQALLDFIASTARQDRKAPPVITVATKIDKLPLSQRKPGVARLGKGVAGVSGETGEGGEALWKRLRWAVGVEPAVVAIAPDGSSDIALPGPLDDSYGGIARRNQRLRQRQGVVLYRPPHLRPERRGCLRLRGSIPRLGRSRRWRGRARDSSFQRDLRHQFAIVNALLLAFILGQSHGVDNP